MFETRFAQEKSACYGKNQMSIQQKSEFVLMFFFITSLLGHSRFLFIK